MLEGRCALLRKARNRVTDPRLRKIIEEQYAQSALRLASMRANTDRFGALKTLVSHPGSFRNRGWWRGAPRVLLKLALPRRLQSLYQRSRTAT